MANYDVSKLYTLPIDKRPAHLPLLPAIIFATLFNLGCLSINLTQILVSPLGLFPPTRSLYNNIMTASKAWFGLLELLIIQWFAPTKLIITSDETMDLENIVKRDASGAIVELRLPQKMILIANHQCWLDWMYLWCLSYFNNAHGHVFIILLDRFKWIPIVGWGMQFFRFIFLARSWITDRKYLGRHLIGLAKRAQKADEPFLLMIYPEGTLGSDETRERSRTYAEKMGIPDMTHMLLPRSTGLLFCLRSLSPSIPNMSLMDVTIGYAGVPYAGYGQDYYTLRSVFFQGIAPPSIHMHFRLYDVKQDLPIGEIGTSVEKGAESTQAEKDIFDKWLTMKFREKDEFMEEFYTKGAFKGTGTTLELPLRMRKPLLEVPAAFAYFVPFFVGYGLYYIFSRL